MLKKERYSRFIDYFTEHLPAAETELHYTNEFELLVAVILSAQCTDKRVNMVTPHLFAAYPQLCNGRSNSRRYLPYIGVSVTRITNQTFGKMSKMLVNDFGGKVPADVDELQKLQGVGRKTANVVASVLYNIPTMPVDTHVFRVSERVGLTQNAKNPLQSEKQLVKHFPKDKLNIAHHWLILHGRYVCLARSPKCEECGITDICKYFEKQDNLLINSR